jgi:lysine 2,3-aminomutase
MDWRTLLADGITSTEALAAHLPVNRDLIDPVARRYPMRITPYYMSLIRFAGDPLWRQAVPDLPELDDDLLPDPDPLAESTQSPVPNLVHRYPDRVLFLVSGQCAMYCRHCMRKRVVGDGHGITADTIAGGIDYIRSTPTIREVLLSGGDPLLIGDDRLCDILDRLYRIDHVEILRIHTRVPCVLPSRITDSLVKMLCAFHPLYINIQFNHPDELTSEATDVCRSMADAGIPLGSQTVLLRGVNDDPAVMTTLMRKLLKNRIRPYYLHHPDPVRGTAHFRVPVEKGLSIMAALRGNVSGMGVPYYMIDLPGGGGKVPLLPEYVTGHTDKGLVVRNFAGKCFDYPV